MKKVYLIRHGLPDFPGGKGMCIGTTDIPMGEKGLAQAAQMAKLLPAVSAVFSSPLTRAVQTAQAIGLPVAILDGLREMYAGEWDGLTFDQIRRRYPELYAARFHDLTIPLPGAEDHAEGLARFKGAMEEAAKQSPGDFAVVAHGGIIAQFLQDIGGRWYKPDYAEIISLLWENGRFELLEES
ncbi:MAG: histidine phosphatase family protein [Oscillospiraceae bacterium]|nr:histidine phosphatase family protein [Oscillospiraceae bacterium]